MKRTERFRVSLGWTPRQALVLVTALASHILTACVPPAEPEEPVLPPEPVDDGGIPWAPGEAPNSAEETTREIQPLDEKEQPPPAYYEEDGVHEGQSSARCSGKAPPALRAEVDMRAQESGACAKKIPEGKAGVSGDMKVSLKVAQDGKVAGVEILSDTLNVGEVTACVEETFKKPFVDDARPRGGCAVFVLPLHFESQPPSEEGEAAPK